MTMEHWLLNDIFLYFTIESK